MVDGYGVPIRLAVAGPKIHDMKMTEPLSPELQNEDEEMGC